MIQLEQFVSGTGSNTESPQCVAEGGSRPGTMLVSVVLSSPVTHCPSLLSELCTGISCEHR